MHKERLLKLADLLEADAANPKGVKFDLAVWAAPAGKAREFKNGKPTLGCDTAACAVGLACLSGAFKRAGLTYELKDRCEWDRESKEHITPLFNGTYGMRAVSLLFNIEEYEADWLFLPDEYLSRQRKGARGELAVAARIRAFVAGKAAP
jgi:hypothetical protein